MSAFGTREEVLARMDGLRRYNAWEKMHRQDFTPQQSFDLADELYEMLTAEARERQGDYSGHGKLLDALQRLS